ncbi:MAG: hypothetical protein PHP79_00575 [Clostridia bacterium]|nr:hypothetical protein [Clostridia bacterium]MDD4679372.1 hypothetical protein [Clostridia bacterium]
MKKYKIGLLPLFLKMYVDKNPDMIKRSEEFRMQIAQEFVRKDVDVVEFRICCVKEEFKEAIDLFTKEEVDAIVTLHLAYSPSLESAGVLSTTDLPIVVLDTTETYDFGPDQDGSEISYNHGIHGVQDMCNLLILNKKKFTIEAGHWKNSDVIERVILAVKASRIAFNMKNSRIGLIGSTFNGMGDFQVPEEVLSREIGVNIVRYELSELSSFVEAVTDEETENELASDYTKFHVYNIDSEIYKASIKSGLAIRKWIDTENLAGFTMNFLEFTSSSGMPTIPFMEACKSMARGIGYAGEGDVLTASLMGAILSTFPDTTFTEMFCPDWQNNSIFLSHMGEMNINLCIDKPVVQVMDFSYTDIVKPVTASGRLKPGKAVLTNLAPGPDDTFSLILAPVEVLDIQVSDNMEGKVRGWIRSEKSVSEFLKQYSMNGGTHHSALVYDCPINVLKQLGEIMNWNVVTI